MWNVFEVPVLKLDNDLVVDQEFLEKKRDLCMYCAQWYKPWFDFTSLDYSLLDNH